MFLRTFKIYVSLFIGCLFVISGNGLLSAYFPIFAQKETSNLVIGIITSFYYLGFLFGCLSVTKIMHRVGHVRTFTFVCSLVAASALGLSLIRSPFSWLPLRFLMGFGYAGLYIVMESWINSHSSDQDRGKVFGIYRVVELISLSIGQFFLTFLYLETPHFHFSIVTLLTVLSALPLSLTLLAQPEKSEPLQISFRSLWGTSQYSTITMVLVGMTNSVIWMLTPLFFIERGLSEAEIPQNFVFFILGGILSQYPIGVTSDRIERRTITVLMAALTLSALVGLYFVPTNWYFKLAFFSFGAFSMPIYSLVMTHAMDRSTGSETGRLSAQLLFLYSLGAIAGPVLCGIVFNLNEKHGYLIYLFGIFLVMVIFGIAQIIRHPSVSKSEKEPFKLFPESSPVILLFNRVKKTFD